MDRNRFQVQRREGRVREDKDVRSSVLVIGRRECFTVVYCGIDIIGFVDTVGWVIEVCQFV